MTGSKPQSSSSHLIIAVFLTLLLGACKVIPKDYPRDKPFVFETNINIEGNLPKEEKDILISQLKNQLHDSLKARPVYKLFYKGFNRSVLEKPPVFDSANADQSMLFMRNLLNTRGYFRNTITYDTTLDTRANTKPPQLRTTVNFNVKPGNQFKIDSISYVINNSDLQAITDVSRQKSNLKKNDPFAQQLISDELNRLVDIYRNNGYLRFSFEELACIWDTLNLAVLRPTIDPFEQVRQLEELQRRRDSPTANIEIRLRPGYDVDRLKKYFVGHTTIYPDYNIVDTTGRRPERIVYDSNFSFISYRDLFKRKFITQNISFRKGDLYNQQRFARTISRFNDIGAWRLVNIEPHPRPESDTVDFDMVLTPNQKYSFTANIEGSYNNTNSIISTAENLFGIGANVQWQNRNLGRSANRSTTTARYATEVDTKGEFVKTVQASLSHTIIFPKPIPNAKWIPARIRNNVNTGLTFSLGNVENKDFYNITSMNVAWGYNFKWRNQALSIKLPNIEYAYVRKRDSLLRFLEENPSLKTVFPDNGLVLSLQARYSIRFGKKRVSQIFRTNFESSGLIFSNVNLPFLDSLFKFVKLDGEYIGNVSMGKKSLIYRAFAGVGVAMTTSDRPTNPNLPFFKQYTAGGPFSMRAWSLRTLGPGSTLRSFDTVPIRFGDVQFEANLEYRFPLFKISSYPVSSCLFTDIGNVWFLRKNPDFPDGTFSFNKFINDLGVGVGTGLRFDFDFFRLRLDYGVKVKNPSPKSGKIEDQNKWFYNFNPLGGIVQIAVNYPFTF